MRIRGAPALGVAAAYGLALAARRSPAVDKQALADDLESAARMLESTRPTAVESRLGAGDACWAWPAGSVEPGGDRGMPRSGGEAHPSGEREAGRAIGRLGAELVAARRDGPHPLQHRRSRHRRLRHGPGRHTNSARAGKGAPSARRRDATPPSGRAPDSVGATATRHSRSPSSSTRAAGEMMRRGRVELRHRRRRPHRRQRRRGQQGRHLFAGGPCEGEPAAFLRRCPDEHDRSVARQRR